MHICVTNALDVVYDPKIFTKTNKGYVCVKQKFCRFYSTNNHDLLQLRILRNNKEFILNDIFTKVHSQSDATYIDFGDIINIYMQADTIQSSQLYTNIASLSWCFNI